MEDDSEATETEEEVIQEIEENYNNRVFFRYDESKIRTQEELLAMGEEKPDKKINIMKNILSLKPRNQ